MPGTGNTSDWNGPVSQNPRRWQDAFPRCAGGACRTRSGMLRRLFSRGRGIWLHPQWYCSPQCFEKAAQERFARARVPLLAVPPPRHRIPLGLLMLSRGQLTNRQLRLALEAQNSEGRGRLGGWLAEHGICHGNAGNRGARDAVELPGASAMGDGGCRVQPNASFPANGKVPHAAGAIRGCNPGPLHSLL